MVFVTAGTQLPFDRLVNVVDQIAAQYPDTIFVVQALKSAVQTNHIQLVDFLSPRDFDKHFSNAKLIISHAGMGTIISALVKKKPIIVMPRLVKFNEHRNDHQLGTAKQMDIDGYVHVAYDEQELIAQFKSMWPDKLIIRKTIANEASKEFIQDLDHYIKSQ
ncbi:glycosyltransferase [Mucilaginibacter glaciei]|uniref:Glycosyl transferase family 28 n=1 Tax=Mucilaginibacter glaciei TaxID=2772109 RepID=A0A926NM46_9SPHI|nr:glycosyltransferase [Mucilaginibacter glaciei]MBD1394634.1 glycosyl transferase family 28 [Mucilaginibacter glaciei]